MPSKSKRKSTAVASEDVSATASIAPMDPDRETWPGWCEVESEPVRLYRSHLRFHGKPSADRIPLIGILQHDLT